MTPAPGVPQPPLPSDGTLCLAVGATCPSWPGDVQLADNGTADFPTAYTVWWGTLLQGGANGSGLQYLRNRYYDPARGRFTQPDPIGLGGGMNLYGFASGDPVNFSDPFGLSKCKDHPNSPACKDGISSIGALDDPILNLALAVFTLGGSWAGRAGLAGARTAAARALGEAGEAVAGIVKNTQRIRSATGTAAFRVPDGLTSSTLTEVKNVAKLGMTNQLRDFAAFAAETGRDFELVIRRSTELTKPLVDFIREKGILVRFLK